MQTAVLKDYPDKLVVTVTECLFSTVQSFVVAVVAERDFSKWKLRFDISLLAILYSVSSALFFLPRPRVKGHKNCHSSSSTGAFIIGKKLHA